MQGMNHSGTVCEVRISDCLWIGEIQVITSQLLGSTRGNSDVHSLRSSDIECVMIRMKHIAFALGNFEKRMETLVMLIVLVREKLQFG